MEDEHVYLLIEAVVHSIHLFMGAETNRLDIISGYHHIKFAYIWYVEDMLTVLIPDKYNNGQEIQLFEFSDIYI